MGQAPYFVVSPNTLLSLAGLASGRNRFARVAPKSREAKVDVLIPVRNEEQLILICLDSLARQTRRPDCIILVDDNSTDRTVELAQAFCAAHGLVLEVHKRGAQQGKTPSVRETAYRSQADVEFVLDGDTVLESATYIERTVDVLLSDPTIASVCGVVLPLRERDRSERYRSEGLDPLRDRLRFAGPQRWLHRGARGITNLYREVLYYFLQHVVYQGQLSLFGTIVNPIGCAVAYRREFLRGLFEHYHPILGDDLTFSEDIFIGFAFLEQGLNNVQLTDVSCRSEEPEAHQAPRQVYLWSSAFLQCCYYFPALVFSPFKRLSRLLRGDTVTHEPAPDPSRGWQANRERATLHDGRPIGWSIFLELFEKVSFPAVLILFGALQWWTTLWITFAVETGVLAFLSLLLNRRDAAVIAFKALLIAPLRYGSILFDMVTFARFLFDIAAHRTDHWRK